VLRCSGKTAFHGEALWKFKHAGYSTKKRVHFQIVKMMADVGWMGSIGGCSFHNMENKACVKTTWSFMFIIDCNLKSYSNDWNWLRFTKSIFRNFELCWSWRSSFRRREPLNLFKSTQKSWSTLSSIVSKIWK